MKCKKHCIFLDDFEHRLAVAGMNSFRNRLIRDGKPTEDVDALLIKLIDAPTKRIRNRYANREG